jgi:hypothetical protein
MKNRQQTEIRQYFKERASRGNPAEALRILARAGQDNPPVAGNELTADWKNIKNASSRKPAEIRKRSHKKKSASRT